MTYVRNVSLCHNDDILVRRLDIHRACTRRPRRRMYSSTIFIALKRYSVESANFVAQIRIFANQLHKLALNAQSSKHTYSSSPSSRHLFALIARHYSSIMPVYRAPKRTQRGSLAVAGFSTSATSFRRYEPYARPFYLFDPSLVRDISY